MEFFQRQLDARKPVEFRAIVTDARAHGLIVEVPDADTTGLVPADMLPGGPYAFEGALSRFVNRRSKRVFKIGDSMAVRVCRVDAARRTIDFAPV
jgi:exoribonuclease R